jgi:uncharacterized protein (TIGR02270 family)
MPYSPPEPRWDIVEEHLDEAEFLWGMWEHSLRAPHYDLDAVARGPEARLAAHLDALVVNGPAVAPRMLVPALASDEPHRISAAAAALLQGPDVAGLDAVFTAWQSDPTRRPALGRALECADRPDVVPRLRADLSDPVRAAAAAEHLVARGEPLGDDLGVLLASDDPAERALGLRAVPDAARAADHAAAVHAALAELEPLVLDAAIFAGVRLGLPAAWARARERALDRGGAQALLLLALADDVEGRSVLRAALAQPRRRADALWALGFVGTPETVDLCAEWLEDDKVGHLAGEAFAAITGVDLVAAGLSSPARERDAREHSPEHALPRPDPMAVLTWWVAHRPRFADGQRHVAGAPRSPDALLAALVAGPMRRRPAVLLDLQIHAPSLALSLAPHAPTSRQRPQLAALRRTLAASDIDLDRVPA